MGRTGTYHIFLSDDEKKMLHNTINSKKTCKTIIRGCSILPESDENASAHLTQIRIAKSYGVSKATVSDIVRAYVDGGIQAVTSIRRNPESDARRKADGRAEAGIPCGPAPEGRCRWTLHLPEKQVRPEPAGRETLRRVKKNELRPRMNEYWCIPPKENADFTAHMEDIPDVYEKPYNSQAPVICMDEKPYQMPGERLEPLPVRPGDIQKTDSEYVRKGTCSIFIFVGPLTGWRHACVSKRRTAADWASEIKYLLTECYPDKEKIIQVMDNLNTHVLASLYKRFPAPEARSCAERLEIHYTQVHGSRLDIAEAELNAMSRQCLAGRIMDLDVVRKEVSAWKCAMKKAVQ